MVPNPVAIGKTGIAIVGLAPTSREDAPYDDNNWAIWTVADAPLHIKNMKRVDAFFEMHPRSLVETLMSTWVELNGQEGWLRNPGHIAALAKYPGPIYVPDAREYPEWKTARTYPLMSVSSWYRRYFTSSIAFMLALAIKLRPEKIGLWGIDIGDAGYDYERACIEFWLGIAIAHRIVVSIAEPSMLLRGKLYGYNPDAPGMTLTLEHVETVRVSTGEHPDVPLPGEG